MPLYEYQCDSCGHRFETIQKFSDPPLEKCPKCGSQLRKLIASPAFQFKGTGWYITDYAKKKDPEAKEKSGSDSAAAEKSSSEKSDKSAKTDSATKSDAPAPSATSVPSKDQ